MTKAEIIKLFISYSQESLLGNRRILNLLKSSGIHAKYLFETFKIGFDDGSFVDHIKDNVDLLEAADTCGLTKNGKDHFKNSIIIPIYRNNAPINIVGYNPFPQKKEKLSMLNSEGIFNHEFLSKNQTAILTEDPLQALLLIQNDYPNTTFIFGADRKYIDFFQEHRCKKVTFTFEGKANLFYALTKNGISTVRIPIDFQHVRNDSSKQYIHSLMSAESSGNPSCETSDTVQEIENGFLFKLPLLSYRVIGNFTDSSMNMRMNIKAFTENDIFVDSIDLYKNRDRQNFIFNLMDKFDIRDQIQLDQEINQIFEIIEAHKEKQEQKKKKAKPELTDYQKEIGINLLKDKNLISAIEQDFEELGYVREKKNKLLLYLVMTSRLMDNPLHAVIISRSGAGKSQLAELTETLCPPEDVESISDLSAQALYYFGKDDLKNKFIVIGEKKGSEGSDYPLRELISRKSITKAIPMKDQATGKIKTTSITVNGPIALVETTTSGEVNPENLNRCYVISIDESEEQTARIHELQRKNQTVEGYISSRNKDHIKQKHIFAQRLLRNILVFNPYAELLTFPSSSLKSRRDNEKFLRLINCVCFLHQYQRKIKKLKMEDNQEIEYIECTACDYRIAYELLSDGVLDNTLDDLPGPARKLLELIKKYLQQKGKKDNIPIDKIIFERKDIREYTSWSFAQIRNNFRILKDYEYIKLIKIQNGLANQYKLHGNYSDLDFLKTILSPEELEKKLTENKDPNKPNIPVHSGKNLVTV
jgi:hypothetical protein